MKRVFYANIFCESLSYPVINFILNIKREMKKDDKIILCFWDKNIYNFQDKSYNTPSTTEASNQVKDTVSKLSNILTSLNMDYSFIFLSDAVGRLLSNEKVNNILFKCLGNLSIGYIEDTYSEDKYLKIRPVTIGKLTYIILDYLNVLYFSSIYPALKIKKIDFYFGGSRFLPIQHIIDDMISGEGVIVDYPRIIPVKTIPILNYNSGKWISVEMSKSEIQREVRKALEKEDIIISDLVGILKELVPIDDFLISSASKVSQTNANNVVSRYRSMDKEDRIMTLTENFHLYMQIVKDKLLRPDSSRFKKINYVRTKKDLENIFAFLNPNILEILKLCNGKNEIKDIVEKSPLKPSSTQSYLSTLRKKKIITKEKKPARNINEVVISFD